VVGKEAFGGEGRGSALVELWGLFRQFFLFSLLAGGGGGEFLGTRVFFGEDGIFMRSMMYYMQ